MARVIWSDQAKADLRAIRRFIHKESPRRAKLVSMRITEATQQLEMFPNMGRIFRQSRNEDYREIIVSPYRILYRLHGDIVRIAAIVHGARRLTDLPDV